MRGTWVRIVASWQMGSEEGFRKLQNWDDGILFVFLPQLQVPTFQSEVWIRTKNAHQQSHVEKLSSAVQFCGSSHPGPDCGTETLKDALGACGWRGRPHPNETGRSEA